MAEIKFDNVKINEIKRKTVKAISNVGHVYLPAEWVGKEVIVILEDEEVNKMEITSENIETLGGVLINVEHMDGPISDMGEPHTFEIRTYQLPDGSRWEDEILNAPWQIGGNSGQVRGLRRL